MRKKEIKKRKVEKKREKINKGKNYDKIFCLRMRKDLFYPICTVPTFKLTFNTFHDNLF